MAIDFHLAVGCFECAADCGEHMGSCGECFGPCNPKEKFCSDQCEKKYDREIGEGQHPIDCECSDCD